MIRRRQALHIAWRQTTPSRDDSFKKAQDIYKTDVDPAKVILLANGDDDCDLNYFCIDSWEVEDLNSKKTQEKIAQHIETEPSYREVSRFCDNTPDDILIMANGYRFAAALFPNNTPPFVKYFRESENTDNLVSFIDRYGYWGGIDGRFSERLKTSNLVYVDGHMSISTSTHRSIPRITTSLLSGWTNDDPEYFGFLNYTGKNTDVGTTHAERFTVRRSNGYQAGRDFISKIVNKKVPYTVVENTHKIEQKIHIAAHSMGYAYAVGLVDALVEENNRDGGFRFDFGGFYILAPENACSDASSFDISLFDQVYQYGSQLGKIQPDGTALVPFQGATINDEAEYQDAIAPQCGIPNLFNYGLNNNDDNFGRSFIPQKATGSNSQKVKRGLAESHSGANFWWIFDEKFHKEGRLGYIKNY